MYYLLWRYLLEIDIVKDVLDTYKQAFGQKVNFDKTEVSFSVGVVEGKRRCLAERLGVRLVGCHGKYPGLLSVVGR